MAGDGKKFVKKALKLPFSALFWGGLMQLFITRKTRFLKQFLPIVLYHEKKGMFRLYPTLVVVNIV